MEGRKSKLKYASGGEPPLLVWQPPPELLKNAGAPSCFALPLLQRNGGLLLAVPIDFLSEEALLDAAADGHDGLLGPSRYFEAPLLEEDEHGVVVQTKYVQNFLAIDVLDVALRGIQEYDAIEHLSDSIAPLEDSMPSALPKVVDLIPQVLEWVDGSGGRVHFYSAREEQPKANPKKPAARRPTNASLMDQLASLANQVQALQEQQKLNAASQEAMTPTPVAPPEVPPGGHFAARLPSLSAGLGGLNLSSKAAALSLGPPPKTRPPEKEEGNGGGLVENEPTDIAAVASADPILAALSSQSTALTALVAHMTSSGDPMSELASSSGGHLSLSSRGVARRERMQQDLANRSSHYFLAVQQQIFKRMNPARQVPKTTEDLADQGASMTAYLERYGGYKTARDAGLSLWIAAHAMDCAAAGDFEGTKEYLALMVASLEQSALDGNWSLAWTLCLLDDPPAMLFADRMQPVVAHGRPFAPLIPPSWASTSLAYLKEIDILVTRKSEVRVAKAGANKAKEEVEEEKTGSPRRRPKFPKRPKEPPAPKA